MISPTVIEKPGRWRVLAAGAVLVLGLLPAAPLVASGLREGAWEGVGPGFFTALTSSAALAVLTGLLSLLVGLPLGAAAGLYAFPGRAPLLSLVSLPVLAPSFLWAIGWSALSARAGGTLGELFSGVFGSSVVFLASAVPLVLFGAMAAVRNLSASQVAAARLAGGEGTVWRHTIRAAAVPAAAAASLASVLTLSDPGPGQIFGLRTVSSEILTSFAALYDFGLAARQSLLLGLVVLVAVLPLAVLAAPRLGAELLARQTAPHQPGPLRHGWVVTLAFLGIVLLLLAPPTLGLVLPLRETAHFSRAWERLADTGPTTLLYAAGAGLLAAALGWLLALAVGRERRAASIALACCVVVFSQPPAMVALGLVRLASSAPAASDPLLRSEFTVVLGLAARLFPVAAVLCLRAWATMPGSWAMAAGVHGVGLGRYGARVLLPHFTPALGAAALLVALLATADVGTVLLLQPPGRQSLPLAIFTLMANAPESLVAALCLVYLAAAAVGLGGTFYAGSRRRS